jgi:RND family efflux transporter MFP subunit
VAVAATAAGCERASEQTARRPAQPVTQVEVVRPERHTVRRTVGEPGQLEAVETTPIHAKIAGYVQDVSVDNGYEIKKGQVLAELWVPELQAELRQKRAAIELAESKEVQAEAAVKVAEAEVISADARLAEVRAGVKRAEADLARWQSETSRVVKLVSDRAVTGSLLDETQSKLHSAESARDEIRARVKSAEASLVESRASLDQARSDVVAATAAIDVAREDARRVEALLEYSKIVAPYDGIITRRHVDTGHLTKPGADAVPLFVAARSDIVTIAVDVPEAYATDVKLGSRVIVKLQAMKGRTVEGKVTRTTWALDPKSRTLRTESDIQNPGGELRPGLYAYATVVVEEHPDVLTVPSTAVVTEKETSYCVAVEDGKARRVPVRLGLSDGARTEVVSGLDGGEALVKANAASLTDGQPLEPIKPEGTSAKASKP